MKVQWCIVRKIKNCYNRRMKIIESSNQILNLKETTTFVIYRSMIIFLTGLLITINSGSNKELSMLLVFLTGPLLMALSIVIGIYSFSKINTIFDSRKGKALRYKVRLNKKNYETITLENVDCVEIEKGETGIFALTSRKKYNLNLRYTDGDCVTININRLSNNEARLIGYKIASLLNVPLKRLK